nr:MAG TPA: glycoside hydrolase [Caudoviricetes sp.]
MTDEQWWKVFKTKFWDKYKADNIKDEWLRYLLVDWLWCSGQWAITKV